MKPKRQITKLDGDKMVNLYTQEKWPLVRLGKEFVISPKIIRNYLIDCGIEIRGKSAAQQHYVDEQFFEKIDTEAKAYFLGLLYADGCVLDKRKHQKVVAISLQLRDCDILEEMRKHLKVENTLKLRIPKIKHRSHMKMLHFSSTKIANDLIKLGCHPRKCHTLKFPTSNQVPQHLIHHFIRGIFDGDGCIYSTAMSRKTSPIIRQEYSFGIVGTEDICNGIMDFFSQEIGLNSRKLSKKSNSFMLPYCGNKQCRAIADYLYKDATIFLSRKREKFNDLIQQSIELEQNPCHGNKYSTRPI